MKSFRKPLKTAKRTLNSIYFSVITF